MRRYFISQYPTFGSYANPTKWKIEQSPYFYWWLALTLNDDYVALCKNPSANHFKTKKELLKVYEDFGDVRFEGDRYIAFAKWWNAKLANGETKGAVRNLLESSFKCYANQCFILLLLLSG